MRVRRLELLAFGSLRDVTLDFGASEPCLHVIYGPNEAGKTTALRALSGLFYGIPANTPDAHTIEPARLRVGALLSDARGRELHVVRRKGNKQTLLAATGEPLEPAEASWLNAGMPESTFRTLFGLSFDTLQRGAEELLASAGDLGQSLFSAAVGGGRVRQVLEALKSEADALYRPRGRTQRLNLALTQFDEAKKRSREGIKPEAFALQQEHIELEEAECLRLQERRLQLRTERERLERARRVLPLLDKQSALRRELTALGSVRRLSNEAGKERVQAQVSEREALLRVEYAQVEITKLEQERAGLEQSLQLGLAALPAHAVETLRDRLSGYRRGLPELPRLREAHARAEHEVERVAGRLQLQPGFISDAAPAGAGVDAATSTRALTQRGELRVGELAQRSEALAIKHTDLQRTAAAKRDQSSQRQKQLRRLWSPKLRAQAELPLVTRFVLPREETIVEFERSFAELDHARQSLDEKQRQTAAQLERNRCDREALALAGAPPTEAELDELRGARDASASELRALLAKRPGDPGVLPGFDRTSALIAQCDALSDRLRREANRVAQAARLAADAASLERELQALVREQTQLEQRAHGEQARWRALFLQAGLAVHSPREASARLLEQRAGEEQCEQWEREVAELERELLRVSEERAALDTAWIALAEELGVSAEASGRELEELLELRAERSQRYDEARQLERKLSELEREQRAFEAHTQALCADHFPAARELTPERAAELVIHEHQKTAAALQQCQQLTAAIDKRRGALDAAQRELSQAERRLSLLMQAAGVDDVVALERAEAHSQRLLELEASLAQLQDEALAAADGQDPGQIAGAVQGTIDDVVARLEEVDRDLAELEDERLNAAHRLNAARGGLDKLRDSHAAGDAAVEAASQLERVRTLAEEYLRVRLAASVLEREVERYRDRHRAPILRAAGELFARLTLAAYSSLDLDYGANDEPILSCVRSDDARISVPALSTGTRDQLYLALRLASIEHLASQRELMPLILDDVLVHFDDDRARAALATLGSFTATTQVLFFTHHQRLCELAQEALPRTQLRLHRLQSPVRLRGISAPLS